MKISLFFFYFCYATNAFAGTLLEKVKTDDFLMQGNLSVVDYAGEHFLVSVGTAFFNPAQRYTIKKVRIEAKLKAQYLLSQFINNIRMNTSENLEGKTVVKKGNALSNRKIDSKYIEIIRETSNGPLKNIINIGTWTDSETCYHALGLNIPQ